MYQNLMCLIQFQSLVIFLDLTNDAFKSVDETQCQKCISVFQSIMNRECISKNLSSWTYLNIF
jgi:hypothetical protein